MAFAHKIKVAVVRGGPSSEYEVSLKTGNTVLQNLPQKYDGVDVFISKDGTWHVNGIAKKPADALKHVDVVFVALHGQFGEDGKVQKILEHIGIPFTGSKSFASAIAMNKHLTKKALAHLTGTPADAGKVKFAAHALVTKDDLESKSIYDSFQGIPYPLVVKPVSCGSSVGICIVKTSVGLKEAVENAFKHSDFVMVEEFIEGREATCGVVEHFKDEHLYPLPPVEIVIDKKSPFFDYGAKYGGESQEICPADFKAKTKKLIQEAALAVHKELGLRHYSRSDFRVHPKKGVYFLEVNTLPGLTTESLLPKSLKADESSLPEFLDHVLSLAREGR